MSFQSFNNKIQTHDAHKQVLNNKLLTQVGTSINRWWQVQF